MKKVLFTAIAAVAMFAMVACNNKKAEEPVAEAPATEQCQKQCDKTQCTGECCQCSEECKAAQCAECTKCGTPECCGEKAATCCKKEGKECANDSTKACFAAPMP